MPFGHIIPVEMMNFPIPILFITNPCKTIHENKDIRDKSVVFRIRHLTPRCSRNGKGLQKEKVNFSRTFVYMRLKLDLAQNVGRDAKR